MADSTHNLPGDPPNPPPVTEPPAPTQRRGASPAAFLLLIVAVVVLAVGFMALQNSDSSVGAGLFVLLLLIGLGVGAATSPVSPLHIARRAWGRFHTFYRRVTLPVAVPASQPRLALAAALSITAIGLMSFSAVYFQITVVNDLPSIQAVLLLFAGAGTLAAALYLARPNHPLPGLNAAVVATPYRLNRPLTIAGIAILLLLSEINGTALKLDFLIYVTTTAQFWMLVAGVTLVALGLGGVRVPGFARQAVVETVTAEAPSDVMSRRGRFLHYGALLLIMVLAFVARFYLLNDTMRFLIDEDLLIQAIRSLRMNPTTGIVLPFSSIATFPYIFPYWELQTMNLFGQNFMGLRAASAIIGALTVPALYFLARTLFDRKTAIIAALLLATFPPHIHFSRQGINEMSGPFFVTLAFAFMGRGLLKGRALDYAAGGVLLGMTQYFDEGSRLLFPIVTAVWLGGLAFMKRPVIPRRQLWIVVVALALVAVPIYYTLVVTNRSLAGRMVENRAGLPPSYWQSVLAGDIESYLVDHVLAAFQVYTNVTDATLYYAGNTPLLLVFVLPVFLLGIAYLLWRWRAPGPLLLLLWISGASMGNSLMASSIFYPRFVIVFPALMLTVAVAVRYVSDLIIRRGWLQNVLIGVAAFGLAALQLNYYFNQHLPLFNVQFRDSFAQVDGYDAMLRSRYFPSKTNIHLIGRQYAFNELEAQGLILLMREDLFVNSMRSWDFTMDYIDSLNCRVDHAFFVQAGDTRTIRRLEASFYLRKPELSPYWDLPPENQFILYFAPLIPGSEAVYGRKCGSLPTDDGPAGRGVDSVTQ